MDIVNSKMIYTGLFFLFIFISGFWLSRSGKPYSSLIFNIHKLIGLGAGIFLIRTVYLTHQAAPLNPAQWTAISVTVLLFAFTVAAGGLLGVLAEGGFKSLGQGMQNAISLVHKFSPYLIALSTAMTLYLLLFRTS